MRRSGGGQRGGGQGEVGGEGGGDRGIAYTGSVIGTSDECGSGPEPGEVMPHPLGMPCERFVTGAAELVKNRKLGAETFYKEVFRKGRRQVGLIGGGAWEMPLPEVGRVQEEEGPEGVLRKFTLRVRGPERGLKGGTGAGDERAAAGREAVVEIESVLIPMIGRKGDRTYTLCVSSQVGCAMGCGFCETAQMGLVRSLEAWEIAAQWWTATHVLGQRVSNMVFMGMGEPMDNLDNVLDAIAALTDHRGGAMPMSKITISTVGRVDGIERLSERVRHPGWRRLGLALSLNAPNDEIRSEIMPVNGRWKMAELQRALIGFPAHGAGKLCVEYVLIPGVNDRREHAAEIAAFCAPINAAYRAEREGESPRVLLNLIPYNPRRNSPWPAPEEAAVDEFLKWLGEEGVYAKRRRTKGRTLMGACGQLGSEAIRGRKFVGITNGKSQMANGK